MKKNTALEELGLSKEDVLQDYKLACESREISNSGLKEVYSGRAKFGLFGDGKEIPQLALARFFQNGDFRSGYYRDQTLMLALGITTTKNIFSQLYAHANIEAEPVSGGRLMTGHFGCKLLDTDGEWLDLTQQKNTVADVSPTASQMPRLLGLAYASKLYRQNRQLDDLKKFSVSGNEIAFGTIGDASTSEGMFFETINAGGVLQVPMHISVWDDGYGISVPNTLQTTKGDISKVLAGFQRENGENGYEIYKVKGWDYPALVKAYRASTEICRNEHVPVLMHVYELTQPNGHSSSGSHKRYKSNERLEWEAEHDCLKKMREWLLESEIAVEDELITIEGEVKKSVRKIRKEAYQDMMDEFLGERDEVEKLISDLQEEKELSEKMAAIIEEMKAPTYPIRSHGVRAAKLALRESRKLAHLPTRQALLKWRMDMKEKNLERYSSLLWNEKSDSVIHVAEVAPIYSDDTQMVDGREILQANFDALLKKDPRFFAIGEDVGQIGDVNQAFAGLQDKYGDLRVTDTGIRECTIIGQAIGAALRGLKPLAEIQYLDYILYAIQIMSDDLATLQYRSYGQQKAPVIVRTRGHRLEGVWHAGSPLGIIINCLRGMYICVPRNMTQAAGMYNTLLESGDPSLVIECLNAYRLKEKMPENVGEFRVELGKTEILREGTDVTVVTYGAMCRIVLDAAEELAKIGISIEVLDIQTLVPFDKYGLIAESIKKTNRVLFADEDVPGGSTAYMMEQVIEKQEAYYYLDSKPKSIHSWAHRPAYASDGDYFSKPNAEDVFDYVYEIMNEVDPERFPPLYGE